MDDTKVQSPIKLDNCPYCGLSAKYHGDDHIGHFEQCADRHRWYPNFNARIGTDDIHGQSVASTKCALCRSVLNTAT